MQKIFMAVFLVLFFMASDSYTMTSSGFGGASPTPVTTFTDNFTAANGTLAAADHYLPYWSPLITVNSGNLRGGSYSNIQSNALQFYMGTTSSTAKYAHQTANAITKQSGRYIEATEVTTFPVTASWEYATMAIFNADDCAPDGNGLPTKNYVDVYWSSNGVTTQESFAIEQFNSSGVQANLGTAYTNTSPVGGTAYRLVLVDATHVKLQKDGVDVISSLAMTSVTLGTNIKAYIGVLSAGRTNGTFVTYQFDNVAFQ